jgi:hypothetical protein
MKCFLILGFLSLSAQAGPYAPAAGQEGSRAISKDDARIMGWATEVENYQPGLEVEESWADSSQVLGPAQGNSFQICSLGRGGSMTVSFGRALPNGFGPDFAVFENGFSNDYLELAFVEVSSDGENFFRFRNRSLTTSAVGAFGTLDPTDVFGLAGKYRQGFGTGFDLAELPNSPQLDKNNIRYVRLLDVIGGSSTDSEGNFIFDPFPTVISAGFDCDGIALLASEEISILTVEASDESLSISFQAQLEESYFLMESSTLEPESWMEVASKSAVAEEESFLVPLGEDHKFYRIESR